MNLILKWSFSIILASSFASNPASGSHLVGGYVNYEHLTGNDYLIKVHIYTDCFINPSPTNSFNVCIFSKSLNMDLSVMLSGDTAFQLPLHPCLSNSVSNCQGGITWQMGETIYSDTVTLPPASDWELSIFECCRSFAASTVDQTLTNSTAVIALYTNSTFDNLTAISNSSPEFNSHMTTHFCIGTQTFYDYSCFDPDGDSIVYRLDSTYFKGCGLDTTIHTIYYHTPYSYLSFLDSSTPVMLDSVSGILSFTATSIQSSLYTVVVDEYRSGVKIGSYRRQDVLLSSAMSNQIETNNKYLVSLSPNPSNGKFTIKNNELTDMQVRVFNSLGENVFTRKIISSENQLDLTFLPDGIYFVCINSEKNRFRTKVIIIR